MESIELKKRESKERLNDRKKPHEDNLVQLLIKHLTHKENKEYIQSIYIEIRTLIGIMFGIDLKEGKYERYKSVWKPDYRFYEAEIRKRFFIPESIPRIIKYNGIASVL